MPKIVKLLISVLVPLVIGFAGGIFTSSSVNNWYTTINKPSFTPPGWLFGPAWTLLYILMGLAFYFAWLKGFGGNPSLCIGIFAVQLILNFLWSILFFGLKAPLYAFVEIVFLWVAILINVIVFFRVSRVSGYLLLPYILWVSFASALNLGVVLLNKF